MPGQNTIIAVYSTREALGRAFSDFQSCVGKVTFSVLARCERGQEILADASLNWLPSQDRDCVTVPGLGDIVVTGPVSGLLLAVLKNAAIFGPLSVLGACFHSMGIAMERISEYEAAVRSGAYLLFIHGSADQVEKLDEVLNGSRLPSHPRSAPFI